MTSPLSKTNSFTERAQAASYNVMMANYSDQRKLAIIEKIDSSGYRVLFERLIPQALQFGCKRLIASTGDLLARWKHQ